MFSEIHDSLHQLYLSDPRPWLVGFSGDKDSTRVAQFDTFLKFMPA